MSYPYPSDAELAADGYVPNPYDKEFNEALEQFKAVVDETEGWINIGNKNGVVMEKKLNEEDPWAIPTVRGKGVFEGVNIKEFLPLITHPGARAHWDARYAEGHPLERYSRRAYKFYTLQKGAFLVQPRDFVGTQNTIYEGSDEAPDVAYLVQTSVPDENEVPYQTRGTLHYAGWKVVQKGEDVDVTYVVNANPNGSLPTAIVSVVVQEIPNCVVNVFEFGNQYGLIPYVVETETETVFRIESYTHEPNAKYVLSVIAKGGETINVAIDGEGKYAGGYSVDVENEAKDAVELDKQTSNLKVTFKPEADGKKVDIIIKQVIEYDDDDE